MNCFFEQAEGASCYMCFPKSIFFLTACSQNMSESQLSTCTQVE